MHIATVTLFGQLQPPATVCLHTSFVHCRSTASQGVCPDPCILRILQGLRCEQLGSLAALTGLTELDVSLCRGVGEATLASLQGLQELRVLNASVCPSLTDAGLEVSRLLPKHAARQFDGVLSTTSIIEPPSLLIRPA